MDIKDLLSTPKIEDLALLMRPMEQVMNKIPTKELNWDIRDTFDISPNQMRFFRLAHSQVGLTVSIPFKDKGSFEKKFRKFLSEFPILRTTFERDKNAIKQRQVSNQQVKLEINVKDISEMADILSSDYSERGFDLFNDALVRILIVTSNELNDNSEMYIRMHHALADAYTNNMVKVGLSKFFGDGENDATDYVPYVSFVNWQKEFLASAEGHKQRNYWTNLLGKLSIPNKIVSQKNLEETGFVEQKIAVSGVNLERLQRKASKFNVPISAIVMGHYQMLLKEIAPNSCSYGIMVNGREQDINGFAVEKLLGVIDNILPIPFGENEYTSEKEFIHASYATYLEARLHQQIPYMVIRDDYKRDFHIDLDDLLAGQFNFQIWQDSNLENSKETIAVKPLPNIHMMNGVYLNCIWHANALEINLICKKLLYEREKEKLLIEKFFENMVNTSKKNRVKLVQADN